VIEVYVDGLCQPVNPGGVAAYGFVIYVDGRRVHEASGVAAVGEEATNNVAEYAAIIGALEWLLERGYADEEVVVRSDSQLAVRQLNGVYAVRSRRIRPLYERVVELAEKFGSIRFEWIPRERNLEADLLSREAYREFCCENRDFMLERYSRWLATGK